MSIRNVPTFPWRFGESLRYMAVCAFIIVVLKGIMQFIWLASIGENSLLHAFVKPENHLMGAIVLVLIQVFTLGGALLFLCIQFWRKGLRLGKMAGFTPDSITWKWALFSSVLGLICLCAVTATVNYLVGPASTPKGHILTTLSGIPFLILSLSGMFLAPLFEEFLFRGFAQNAFSCGLKDKIGVACAETVAVFASAVLFAAVHFTGPGFAYLFAGGVVFALIYRLSGSIVPAMLVHFLVNSLTFALMCLR